MGDPAHLSGSVLDVTVVEDVEHEDKDQGYEGKGDEKQDGERHSDGPLEHPHVAHADPALGGRQVEVEVDKRDGVKHAASHLVPLERDGSVDGYGL